ncbi:hypothetical protein [Thiocystis violacea]|uniref:hypothetical protein n=1 Tax=Thiocystis violacea TaxID=13725 RepID=UPI001905F2A3|nr:hypothetical protein [Thiocystis violacea]MBK1719165.1 hypothetical protein [Thiocystis violacea]
MPITRDLALGAWVVTLDPDAREFFEERAAVVEYDAGLPRDEAEALARTLTLAYLQRREARDGSDRSTE